jgi:hypothetical protein
MNCVISPAGDHRAANVRRQPAGIVHDLQHRRGRRPACCAPPRPRPSDTGKTSARRSATDDSWRFPPRGFRPSADCATGRGCENPSECPCLHKPCASPSAIPAKRENKSAAAATRKVNFLPPSKTNCGWVRSLTIFCAMSAPNCCCVALPQRLNHRIVCVQSETTQSPSEPWRR